MLENTSSNMLKEIYQNMDELTDIYELIERAIIEEPGITITEGNIIKQGYNEEVDRLNSASTEGKNWLINLEAREKEETGIKNLKISYNKVFGYYIEVTKSNLKFVPENRYIRKQTLTNGERFITEELKEIEDAILRFTRKTC
jgi:DNA mismatch repair protein MutS